MTTNSLFDLSGKVAVVTGASKGIGKDVAVYLSESGADMVLIARDQQELESVADTIEKRGRKALPIAYDLADVSGLDSITDRILRHYGHIDILFNNAGTNIPKPALDVTEEDWDTVLGLNLKSAFFMTQSVGRHMVSRKKGKIINMSSQMALVGYQNRSAYAASKAGLSQLTRQLAIEWAPYHINVNAVAPTFVETPLTRPMLENEAFRQEVINRIPLGRVGKTEDLFGAVLYLASEASDMVTGQTLVVDGGWTVW
ncbi:MAG: glucose 1-dehydrogenase [Bacillaceae bacterium]|nr:glucose 1-dehydrogenase [Bacillaceae bacterium]